MKRPDGVLLADAFFQQKRRHVNQRRDVVSLNTDHVLGGRARETKPYTLAAYNAREWGGCLR